MEEISVKFFRIILLSVFILISHQSVAMTPSKQQIEQFKKLPKAQQEALAKRYGIDLSTLDSKTLGNKEKEEKDTSIQPRNKNGLLEEEEEEDKFKPKQEELKPFGYELFAGEPLTFMPSELAAIPDTYLLGIGDLVKINLYGKTNEEHEVQIDREGRLAIPNLSPVHVIGLSFKELKALITKKISEEMIGVQAFVSMGELNPMRIMVVGEAYKPGSYTVSPLATVTHALFVSGGVSDSGSLRKIQVKRAGKLVTTFDLYDLLLFGDSSDDVVLKPGDVVFIPPAAKKIKVKGEVNRQAIFELKESDTLESVMAMSGGFKANANKSKVVVSRYNGDGRRITLNYNFTENTSYKPQNGDEISVNAASTRFQNTVTVVGAVTSPGHYEWHQGKTLKDVFSAPREDLLSIADFGYSLIIREVNFEGDIEIIQFSLQDIFNGKSGDIELVSNDSIVVFSRYQLKEEEEQLLEDLAYNKEQLKLRENVKLWEQFERDEFLKYIGLKEDELFELEEEVELITSIDALFQEPKEVEDEEYAVFSRQKLLAPILAKLQRQATPTEPAQLFAVNGQVKFPGVYPLSKNANFQKAVQAGGGFLEAAYLEQVELTRVVYDDGKQVEHIQFNGVNELANPTQALTSKDTVNIFPRPNWQERLQVKVVGEVKFPGTYTIKRGETLDSLLERVGGFNQFAHKEAAIFTRESIKRKETSQIQRLTQELRRDIITNTFQKSATANTSMPYEDMDKILRDLSKVEALGRLVIDLDKRSTQALQLEDGDALYIPAVQDSVSVIGEVNLAATHLFDSSKSVDDYIKASGGLKQKADDERIYIIKANGSVELPGSGTWFAVSSHANQLAPGDTIVVPLDAQHIDSLTLWSTATQIIYQLGLAAASIATLNK
ncbi:SLBB domain-containing protein [Pseudoalteromonas sp. B530]|uniref:SLBB domain-containing protein n=2 Tax=unclassified Pseudoalteromonas TaxID=194690 RepID=UPI003A59929C